MKVFEGRKKVSITAEQAWRALEEFDKWLPQVSSIAGVDKETPSLVEEGSQFTVRVPEGVAMKARVILAQHRQRIRIAMQAGRLMQWQSESEIIPAEDGVELVRRQAYPGLLGAIIGLLANGREEKEVAAYVDQWSRWAEQNKGQPTAD